MHASTNIHIHTHMHSSFRNGSVPDNQVILTTVTNTEGVEYSREGIEDAITSVVNTKCGCEVIRVERYGKSHQNFERFPYYFELG